MSTTIALLGTGNIAAAYAASIEKHPDLQLVGVHDIERSKAAAFAGDRAIDVYDSFDSLRAADVDLVVNLTSAPFHFATTKRLLESGQPVFSEKPLALTVAEAQELVALARDRGVRLACAPSLWLGPQSLEVARAIDGGELGRVGIVTAEVNQGRIEDWHPSPESFYTVGPVVDAGIYPLTFLTAVLGPLRTISAQSAILQPERTTRSGHSFRLTTPDSWVVTGVFDGGAVLNMTCNYVVSGKTVPRTVHIHGSTGSFRIRDQYAPFPGVDRAAYGDSFAEWLPADESEPIDFALGLADLAASIDEARPHRTSAAHAAHVVEVLEAIRESATTGRRRTVGSTFPVPSFEQQGSVAR